MNEINECKKQITELVESMENLKKLKCILYFVTDIKKECVENEKANKTT